MTISYAITVCNEIVEIQRLLSFLLENKRKEDEIVVVFDSNNGSKAVEDYLRAQNVEKTHFRWYPFEFKGHFADLKNKLTSFCNGDYIFQIDADEIPHKNLLETIPEILTNNPGIDVLRVPRVNTVEGLTSEHIQKWGWSINDYGWVNWPDYQWRIYRNTPEIKWINKVHERLDGYKVFSNIPPTDELALHHPKTIERQEKQNSYYSTL